MIKRLLPYIFVLLCSGAVGAQNTEINESLYNKIFKIALLVPVEKNDFLWNHLINVTQLAATDMNVDLRVYQYNSTSEMVEFAELIASQEVDGVLYKPIDNGGAFVLSIFDMKKIPIITFNTTFFNQNIKPRSEYANWIGRIDSAEKNAGELLARQLITSSSDHKRVLAIANAKSDIISNQRLSGLTQALNKIGFSGELEIVHASESQQETRQQLYGTKQLNHEYSFIWSSSDKLALLASEVFLDEGVPIGGFYWTPAMIKAIKQGAIHASVGGDYLNGVFALSMLVDYLHGIDFATQKLSFNSLMLALNNRNLSTFSPLITLDSNIDFSYLSLAHNPDRFSSEFDLDTALNLIKTAELDKRGKLNQQLSDWVENNRVIRFGAHKSYDPYDYQVEEKHMGLVSGYFEEITSETGLTFELNYRHKNIDKLERLLKEKKIDVLPIMVPNGTTPEGMLFSNVIISDALVIFGNISAGVYDGIEALRGKKVGVFRSAYSSEYLIQKYPALEIVRFSDLKGAFTALEEERVDAVITMMTAGMYTINRMELNSIAALAPIDEDMQIKLAVREDWPELVDIINHTLTSIDEHTKQAIFNHWVRFKYEVGVSQDRVILWFVLTLLAIAIWFVFSYVSRHRVKLQLVANQRMNQRFQALFDSSSELIFVIDESGIIEDCNKSTVSTLEFNTKNDVIGQSFIALSSKYQQNNILSSERHQAHLQLLAGKEDQLAERWHFKTAKSESLVVTGLVIKKISFAMESKLLVTAHNLTESIRLHKRIEDERNFLQEMLKQSPIGVTLVIDGRCHLVNQQLHALTDLNDNDFLKTAFVHESDYRLYDEQASSAVYDFSQDVQWTSKDGHIHDVWLNSNKLMYEGREAVLCWVVNVTEFKLTQSQLIHAKELAEAATQAKSDFLANMSHEIRTPMNAILGMSYLALENTTDKTLQRYITNVHSAANNLMGIINDILDFSKIDAGMLTIEITTFNLQEIIRETCSIVNVNAEKKAIELVVDMPHDTPLFWQGDPLRLKQIMLNLLNNAVKFTAENGRVILEIATLRVNDSRCEMTIAISDSGIGMSAEVVDRLFSPFSQGDSSTSRKYGGTGLGLTISKKLVELMNGTINVTSQEGEGSCFSFTLALTCVDTPATQEKSLLMQSLKSATAVIVGTPSISRATLDNMLHAMGLSTTIYDQTAEVIECHPDCDFILCIGLTNEQILDFHRDASYCGFADKMHWIYAINQYDDTSSIQLIGDASIIYKPVTSPALFDALLPMYDGAEHHAPQRSPRQSLDFTGKNILLVEDNFINQELTMGLLVPYGGSVDLAENGAECLEKIKSKHYDLVLMDCQMPIMNGYEATQALRAQAQYDHLPIIAMTANALQGDKDKVFRVGMNDYIAKPINVNQFVAVLSKWLKLDVTSQVKGKIDTSNRIGFETERYSPEQGLLHCDNNSLLYKRLLESFIAASDKHYRILRDAAKHKQFDALHREAHTIKGLSSSLGGVALAQIAGKLELLFNGESCPSENLITENINTLHEILLESVGLMKNHLQVNYVELTPSIQMGSQQISELIGKLRELLDSCDTEAITISDTLADADVFKQAEGKKLIEKINNYEFDEALIELDLVEQRLQSQPCDD